MFEDSIVPSIEYGENLVFILVLVLEFKIAYIDIFDLVCEHGSKDV
jgi:hypothetical protein